MAEHKRPLMRFKPTLLGLLCIVLPLPFCIHALLTNDAVLLVISAGFLSIAALSALLLVISIPFFIKVFSPDSPAPALPLRMLPGRTQIIPLDPERPASMPGIRLSVCRRMSFGERRYTHVSVLPSSGPAQESICVPNRGEWRVASSLRAADVFGFFHLDWVYPGVQRLVVPPIHRDTAPGLISGRPSSDAAALSRLHDDAEEKLERRAYVPGDDPRRIDWKHYAAMGGLLLRTGEEGIPFRGRVWLLVPGEGENSKAGRERLDISLEAASTLAHRLCRDNVQLTARLPGESAWTEVRLAGSEEDERVWEHRVAAPHPVMTEGNSLPAAGEHLLLVSHPQNPAALRLAKDAASAGNTVSLVFPAQEGRRAADGESLFSWKSLLFRRSAALEELRRGKIRYQQTLIRAEQAAGSEIFDVRRI